ncbi:MAG: beta-propeller domain-containing protein [Aestuariibacter sp.]
MKLRVLVVSVSLAILAACGGSSVSIPEPEPLPPEPTPPDISAAKAFPGSLKQSGSSAVELFIKNGIYASSTSPEETLDGGAPPIVSATTGFSTTNTQEQGVDEADRVEYNGSHLFLATQPEWQVESFAPAAVRVLARNEDFSLTEVNRLETEEEYNITGMYLYQQRLSVVSSGFPIMTFADIAIMPGGGFQDNINVQIYDTNEPADASIIADIEIQGWLLASRRIEDRLYLVSAYRPSVDGLNFAPDSDQQKIDNYNQILATPIAELMPDITINNVATDMNQAEDCYIPEQATERDGFNQLLTVTRIDLNQPELHQSICISALADLSYMSLDSLYLAAQLSDSTSFHKVALGEAFSYQASGEVDGVFGWRGNPQLRMSEADGYFRVVTSQFSGDEPEHMLHVLRQNGNSLDAVVQLPNEQQPEPIGKPGEDIYAVRFIQDKAYIVTFERIDPLYVIDLQNNESPFVAGSLEIPGFSSYLHPLENGYLLGVGQDVDIETIPATGTEPAQRVTTAGLKVSLFDVADPANPVELQSISREDSYTPVEYDYRALSVLKTGDQYQFAMPTETWTPTDDGPGIALWNPQSKLMLLNVDASSAQGSLSVTHELVAPNDPEHYVYSGEDRSVIHGEHVYYIHGNQVWHSLWQAEAALDGPY